MTTQTVKEQLKGLHLGMAELAKLSGWPAALLSDYLSISYNFKFLSETIDRQSQNTVLITAADSPYSVTALDRVIFCDTDGGAITVLLPAGAEGRELILKNVGTALNYVTLTPSEAETVPLTTLFDGETLETVWNATEFWK